MSKRRVPADLSSILNAGALLAVAVGLAGSPARAEGQRAEGPRVEGQPAAAVTVSVDNAKVMRLPPNTQTVVVGNPGIADVTMQRNGVLILTGKSYGTTNLIALDASGVMVAESFVNVRAPEATAMVTVQRGLERESYSCTPNCQPSVQLGDSTKFFGEVSGQAGSRNAFANPAAPAR